MAEDNGTGRADDLNKLVENLQSEDENERLYAVHDLADLGGKEVPAVLMSRLLTDDSDAVKDAIVFSLKNMDKRTIYDSLFGLFYSPDPYMRNAAVTVFGNDDDNGIAYLTSKLDDSNQEVRKLILDSLVEIGGEYALIALRAALHDTSENVKITAVEYIGRLSDARSLDELIELFKNDDEPMLRMTILDAFKKIGDKSVIGFVMNILAKDGKMTGIDKLYFAEFLNLVGQVGGKDEILSAIDAIEYSTLYAEDIINFIMEAMRKFPELRGNAGISGLVSSARNDGSLKEELKSFLDNI